MFNVSMMEIRKKQPTSMRFHREVLFLSHFEGNVWGHDSNSVEHYQHI